MSDKVSSWLDKFGRVVKEIDKVFSDSPNASGDQKDPDILTAEKLSQLKWLSASQLAAIYKYGKVPTKIADDGAAYSQLKWFTGAQLNAIFGKEFER